MDSAPNSNGKSNHVPPSLAPSSPALEVKGLKFSYPDKPGVLKGLNVSLLPGERLGLIGPNGAGKTTFFMLICGVQKAEAGEISLFGQPVKHRDFHPEIGMVFQNSADQLFSPTVRDDVAFGPQNLGLAPAAVEARVTEALTTTGVIDLADRPPHHLSGGERRMVSIAGILAMQPQLIIYDEPSANLDIRSRRRLINFLKTSSQAYIISSHDLEFILEVCDRVLLLDEGRIIADGDPRVVMADAVLMEAHGLEKPHSLRPHPIPHHSP
ncbi:MAG TPA: ABC transporter ATP-binding protein [Anaerolineae bacterium]|nr:ABC transporter ATP-binding protein [Anaerolineae bacterium]HMR67761.1 ABC transporter ATP-binding protein [Anaerolineae bacterium]